MYLLLRQHLKDARINIRLSPRDLRSLQVKIFIAMPRYWITVFRGSVTLK